MERLRRDRGRSARPAGESSSEYIKTGISADFGGRRTSVPAGLIPHAANPGLGPRPSPCFGKSADITSVEELIKAIEEGKLDGLKGIGEKKIESIKQGIAMRLAGRRRMGIVDALPIARSLVERLRELPQVEAGGNRRQSAPLPRNHRRCRSDLRLQDDAAGRDSRPRHSSNFPKSQRILGQGVTKASVVTAGGLQVDLRIVPAENFGAALLYFTGSQGTQRQAARPGASTRA